ncbi:hypothetical protein PHET_02834 [Paragonimus heterotremus]|uniref:BHLH domain-containing protein n=1 Tax=Paragonimus heterotremus TaxID=100268 RepID=A0A8J4WJH7_9TREM|nr:hypothetical protein PHET_02834 [Paragonimus heterotremus]
MFPNIFALSLEESIIEGVGNELLLLISFVGIAIFLILAWMSTRVSWELLPMRITLVQENTGVQNSGPVAFSNENRAPTPQPDSAVTSQNHAEPNLAGDSESSSDESSEKSSVPRKYPDLGESHISETDSLGTSGNVTVEEQEAYAARFRSKGHLVIRLQYVDDRTRFVHASPDMLISRFKRKYFADELLQQHRNVRLIFQGRELTETNVARCRQQRIGDQSEVSNIQPLRLRDYDIHDGSTIHCLITNAVTPSRNVSPEHPPGRHNPRGRTSPSNDSILTEFDMGTRLMEPLFAFLLAFTWFFRIVYRQYFNSLSTFALIALSIFFCGAVFAVNIVNVVSSLTAFTTRRRNTSRTNGNTNNTSNTHQDTTDPPRDVRVVTVTMVARRIQRGSSTNDFLSQTTDTAVESAPIDEHTNTVNSVNSQESHSEIERKRRERMKRDTEFLRKQVHSSQCKDKLSIFQAGAERLIQYTEKLGKRNYIINDEEYTRLILSSFEGFDIHIRCSDGEITRIHKNVEKILDLAVEEIVGRTIQDLAEPSTSTRQIIGEVLFGSESQWDIFKGLIARNFILALRCGPSVPLHHCIYGSDGNLYRFVEFCGDLSHQDDPSNATRSVCMFRGLCRPLDPACGTVASDPSTDDPPASCPTSQKYFTLRLSPSDLRVIEVVGHSPSITPQHIKMESMDPVQCTTRFRTGADCSTSLEPVNYEQTSIGVELSSSPDRHQGCLTLLDHSCQSRKMQDEGDGSETPIEDSVQSSLFINVPAHQLGRCELSFTHLLSEHEPSRSDAVDEWFQNVDTSHFKSLLTDDRFPPTECFMDMLQENRLDL